MKGSCSWLVGRYGTCLQCSCKLVFSDVSCGLYFASFFHLKQKNGSDVIALYKPSYQPAYNTLGPSNSWIWFAFSDFVQGSMLSVLI